MCNIDNCYECKLFRLKEVAEGEYIGWCSFYDRFVGDVKESGNEMINKDE